MSERSEISRTRPVSGMIPRISPQDCVNSESLPNSFLAVNRVAPMTVHQ